MERQFNSAQAPTSSSGARPTWPHPRGAKRRPLPIGPALAGGLVLFGLAGCTPKSERYMETAATFWDGLWHGIITPWLFVVGQAAMPMLTTDGYQTGLYIGIGWTLIWGLAGMAGILDESTSGLGGCFAGCTSGVIFGALIYWTCYGVVALLAYLGGSIVIWWQWLSDKWGRG